MIYLDNAATTLRKPRAVDEAVRRAMHAAAGYARGGYAAAMRAGETVYVCREQAAALFGVRDPARVVFTMNATHALNLAIHALARPGMRIAVSGYEHNAVTRPLCGMQGVQVQVASGPLFDRAALLEQFYRQLRRGVKAVVCTHVSNVFGMVLPIDEIAALCRERETPLIVDASQSAGILPVDLRAWGAAFVAIPGHKGLYGPQGTGLLLCGAAETAPLIEGGTGSMSLLKTMPADLPDRLEAGTQNIPGIAGLLEGLRFVRRIGPAAIARHERDLIRCAAEGLRALPEAQVFAGEAEEQSGVLSFRLRGRDCEGAAAWFAGRDIALRAGYHCAPLAHKTAGTLDTGTIRLSVAAFNTRCEIADFLQAAADLAAGKNP